MTKGIGCRLISVLPLPLIYFSYLVIFFVNYNTLVQFLGVSHECCFFFFSFSFSTPMRKCSMFRADSTLRQTSAICNLGVEIILLQKCWCDDVIINFIIVCLITLKRFVSVIKAHRQWQRPVKKREEKIGYFFFVRQALESIQRGQ